MSYIPEIKCIALFKFTLSDKVKAIIYFGLLDALATTFYEIVCDIL